MSKSFTISESIKWGFSLVCLCLIIIHALFPDIIIDSTTLGLLLLLLTPHLLHLLKKIGLPGGGTIEIHDISKDVKELQEKEGTHPTTIESGTVTQVGPEVVRTSSVDHFYTVSDPSISVAALRIDLERKIRKLASLVGVADIEYASLRKVVDALKDHLDLDVYSLYLIRELYSLSNRVVHGEQISSMDATYLLEKGKIVIKYLESEIAVQELSQRL